MNQILGVLFLILTVALLLVALYCIGVGITGYYGYLGVAVGVLMSCAVAGFITKELLKQR